MTRDVRDPDFDRSLISITPFIPATLPRIIIDVCKQDQADAEAQCRQRRLLSVGLDCRRLRHQQSYYG